MELTSEQIEEMKKVFKEDKNKVSYTDTWRDILKDNLETLKRMESTREEGRIKTPREYFCRMPLSDYSNIDVALPREFLQNSLDARSTRIDISATMSDGYIFSDNGCGMDKDIILNNLLSLGGTYKEGDCVGGFGKAKEILYFCWPDYIIHSKNNLVLGMQNKYIFYELPQSLSRKGTSSRIQVWDASKDEFSRIFEERDVPTIMWNRSYLSSRVSSFVNNCRRKTPIYFEGEKLKYQKLLKPIIENESVKVWKYPSKLYTSKLFILVDGIFMFSNYVLTLKNSYVIDISGNSREILTSNRDSVRGEYENLLKSIERDLSECESKAKKGVHKTITYVYRDKNSIITPYSTSKATNKTSSFLEESGSNLYQDFYSDKATYRINDENSSSEESIDSSDKNSYGFWLIQIEKGYKTKARKILDNNLYCNTIREMMRLALSVCFASLLRQYPYHSNKNISMGLSFTPESEDSGKPGFAGRIKEDSNLFTILVNPFVLTEGLESGNFEQIALLILTICEHEMTHIVAKDHDDDFISELWHICKGVSIIEPKIIEKMAAIGESFKNNGMK